MKITFKQKFLIKKHYPHLILRFMSNGEVQAKKSKSGVWGILYNPEQTKKHLDALAPDLKPIKPYRPINRGQQPLDLD